MWLDRAYKYMYHAIVLCNIPAAQIIDAKQLNRPDEGVTTPDNIPMWLSSCM